MEAINTFLSSVTLTQLNEGSWELNYILPENLPYFQGHFPGHPILPAIAVVELTSQMLTTCIGLKLGELKKLTRAKFTQTISPQSAIKTMITQNGEKSFSVQWLLETRPAAQYSVSYQ